MSNPPTQRSAGADAVVGEREAAELLGVALRTLHTWRRQRRGPLYLKYGGGRAGAVRYRISDLEAFLAESTVTPDAAPPRPT